MALIAYITIGYLKGSRTFALAVKPNFKTDICLFSTFLSLPDTDGANWSGHCNHAETTDTESFLNSGDIHDKKCQEEKRRFSLTFPDATGTIQFLSAILRNGSHAYCNLKKLGRRRKNS